MKKYKHPIDDFFRENLKDYQITPTESARQAFLKEALTIDQGPKKGRKGLILFSGLLILCLTGIIFWAVTSNRTSQNSQNGITNASESVVPNSLTTHKSQGTKQLASTPQPQVSSKSSIKSDAPALVANNKLSSKSQPQLHVKSSLSSGASMAVENNKLASISQHQIPGNASFSSSAKTIVVKNKGENHTNRSQLVLTSSSARQTNNLPESSSISPAYSGQTKPIERTEQPLSDTITRQSGEISMIVNPGEPATTSQSGIPPDKRSTNKRPDTTSGSATPVSHPDPIIAKINRSWYPAIGVYYTPEWMFNTLEGTKFVNNFGFEGTFHFGRFSVRTGAGLSLAKGTNELTVEYNDFLGAYNKLDSMKFTWDDPTHEYLPKYYMSQQNVWDSLLKLEYPKVVKRYTYLQIPLIMGYEIWQSEKISIGVRVGPVMSVLLATKQLSSDFDPGKKKVVSINDISPEQVSLNWQLLGGFNFSVFLTKELAIEFEPYAKYYFNSVYEKPVNNAKPSSIGIRTAIVVKL